MTKVIHGGFTNKCSHIGEDTWILIKNLEVAFCRKCGDVYYGDEWFNCRVLITALLVDDDEEMAMQLFDIMNKFRKSGLIKYVYIPESELRKSAAKMRKELDKHDS